VAVLRSVSELTEPLTADSAYARVASSALTDSVLGLVGLEVETHLVDLDAVTDRVGWPRIDGLLPTLRDTAARSSVTVEPGGQIELSGSPAADVSQAATLMRDDVQRARLRLLPYRLGLAHVGADPLRPARRVNPNPRYQAMEEHFVATGRTLPGLAMMNSTAALQVNVQAGPRAAWAARVAHAHRLGPTLIAISACSPWLAGRDTGWRSARQRTWGDLDTRQCGAVADTDEPAEEWARYAMRAPVVLVRRGADAAAVRSAVPFSAWVSGAAALHGRAPTTADLDTHLTTLFPPVRLRGYLELRYLDMSPPRWWPAVAAVAVTLMDDARAADAAAEATEPAAALWNEAARDGLRHPVIAKAAHRCMAIAVDRAPTELATAVADLAQLVERGRCPGDDLAERITQVGPRAAFEELAHA
jgi:glutamate--cysteine ligase